MARTRPLPSALLRSADAIFAAGGYQQAASAYAHLTVHYGNHDELAVRRFVALVASGDCDQAAVLFELATSTGQQLAINALPVGGLAELYGEYADSRTAHADFLAEYALRHPHDHSALAMVGTWLELDAQSERAQPFLESARRLAADSVSPIKTPAIASRLVVAEPAR